MKSFEKYTFIIDIKTDKKNILKKVTEALENMLSDKDEIEIVLVDENNIKGIRLSY